MRPIDADELMQKYCGACDIVNEMFCMNCKYHELRQGIKNAPTIEPEVRHGEWVETEPDEDDRKIRIEFSIKCSRCHDENSHLDFNENHEITGKTFWTSRFCPNCGAKMDEGEK